MDHKIKISFFFIGVSAFLYATKHITAAIMSAFMNNGRANYYEGSYDIVGFGITFWIFIAFLTGFIFFINGVWNSMVSPYFKNRINKPEEQADRA